MQSVYSYHHLVAHRNDGLSALDALMGSLGALEHMWSPSICAHVSVLNLRVSECQSNRFKHNDVPLAAAGVVTSGWAMQALICTAVISAMTMYKYTFFRQTSSH